MQVELPDAAVVVNDVAALMCVVVAVVCVVVAFVCVIASVVCCCWCCVCCCWCAEGECGRTGPQLWRGQQSAGASGHGDIATNADPRPPHRQLSMVTSNQVIGA